MAGKNEHGEHIFEPKQMAALQALARSRFIKSDAWRGLEAGKWPDLAKVKGYSHHAGMYGFFRTEAARDWIKDQLDANGATEYAVADFVRRSLYWNPADYQGILYGTENLKQAQDKGTDLSIIESIEFTPTQHGDKVKIGFVPRRWAAEKLMELHGMNNGGKADELNVPEIGDDLEDAED